jgi:hypothetical protein
MMDYGGDDFKVSPRGKHKSYEVDYESLSQSAVENLMAEDVDYICSVCGVDVSSLAPVLSNPYLHFAFSCRRALRAYCFGIASGTRSD